MKKLETYVDNIKEESGFGADNIVVEHRSNNKKRDFLFVNKAQCMHIPGSPDKIISMCKMLAKKARDMIGEKRRVLVIGFAETATAIANFVADYLPNAAMVMTTTREDMPMGKLVCRFSEAHSHATEQKLYMYGFIKNMLDRDGLKNMFDYILFVEDEISTGKTIINAVSELRENYPIGNLRVGVASVCNWQDEKARQAFKDNGIESCALITGTLKDAGQKMNIASFRQEPFNILSAREAEVSNIKTSEFVTSRLGNDAEPLRHSFIYKVCGPIVDRIADVMDTAPYPISCVRVIGTEEYKYAPICLAKYLEENYYVKTLCQSTTRSPIDIISLGDGTDSIVSKYQLPSIYQTGRVTYLYNLDASASLTLVVTDAVPTEDLMSAYKDVLGENTVFLY